MQACPRRCGAWIDQIPAMAVNTPDLMICVAAYYDLCRFVPTSGCLIDSQI